MAPVIFVEELDRRRRLCARVRLERFPATIGRGYGNDIIVDDRFLDVEHLRIVEAADGGLTLEGATPAASFEDPRTGRSLARVPIADDVEVRAGTTIFRFRTLEHDVGPVARRNRVGEALLERLGSWPAAAAAFLGMASVVAWMVFLQTRKEESWALLASKTSIALGLPLIWSGLWSFTGRVIAHEARVRHHLTVTCLAGLAFVAWDVGWDYLSFLSSADWAVAKAVAGCALFGALVFAHGSLVSGQSRSRRLIPAVAITGCLLVVALLVQHASRQEFNRQPSFPAQLKPLPPPLIPAADPADFFSAMPGLRDRVDRLAAQRN